MMRRLATVVAVSLAVCSYAYAEEACEDTVDVDRHRLLRQLTLDLLGRVPTMEEFESLGGQVTEADVDKLLDSAEFSNFVRRPQRPAVAEHRGARHRRRRGRPAPAGYGRMVR